MPGESLSFPITADDRASGKFRDVGNAALGAAGKVDLAAASLKLWDATSVRFTKSINTVVAAEAADLKAKKLLADAYRVLNGEATKFTRLQADQSKEAQKLLTTKARPGLLGFLQDFAGIGGGAGGGAAAGGGGVVALAAANPLAAAGIGAAVLGSGLAGLVPALAAATTGFAAFGALALPTITALTTRSRAMRDVRTVFASLVAALRPDVVKLFNQAMRILVGLLPQLLPFANAAAKAFGMLLTGFGRFASSNAFGLFLNQLNKLTGPTILTIGKGLGQVTIALGKLLIALTNPNALRIAKYIFIGIAGFITILAKVITWATGRIIENLHAWAGRFDVLRHNIAADVHNISTWIDALRVTWVTVGHALEATANAIVSTFDQWRHAIAVKITTVVGFFKALPRQILSAMSGLGHQLWQFGSFALGQLWSGFKSVFNSVWSWFKSLPGKLLHAIGIASPPGWAIEAGKHIMGGLLHGITSRKTQLQKAFAATVRGGLGGQGGPGGGAPAANAALAYRLYASQLTPASWAAWNYVAMRESGWNQFARNPSSGAYGIAQALPATKYPFAGQAAGGSNPMAQITWMWNYMRSRYGGPLGAEAHELAFNWYEGGSWRVPRTGPAVVHKGEMIFPPLAAAAIRAAGGGPQTIVLEVRGGAEGRLTAALLEMLRHEIRTRGGGNVQTAIGRA